MMNQDAVAIDVQEMLERAESAVTDECCIYRVPFDIRRHREDVYTPKFLSIGPFHHNRHAHLQNMEKYKLTYCKQFLQRTGTSSDQWIRYIEEVEHDFRRCYLDTLEFSKEQLLKIIFVDSGFIFEYFFRFYYLEGGAWNDILMLTPKLWDSILLDLVLLENQLPFFVLEGLFNLSLSSASSSGKSNIPSFRKLMIHFFKRLKNSNLPYDHYYNINIRHFTDLVRSFHLPHPQERGTRSDQVVGYFPSISELLEAGMRFKVNTKSRCILDLKFSGHTLEIPQFDVDDIATQLLFHNMVALEQFLYPFETYITDYAQVMDLLVNTSKDVDILIRHRILANWLRDTVSVAKLFNGLVQNITIYNSSPTYLRLSQDLNAFYKNPWNKWKSTLKRDYCSSPWQTAATTAAIVLLILSFVQSVCSVMQVIQQR